MPRSLPGAIATDVQAQGAKYCDLILLNFYDPGLPGYVTQRLATADADVSADVADGNGVQTWDGVGGRIEVGPIKETDDLRTNDVTILLSGVDQGVITEILSKDYIGRACKVWRARFSGASVIVSPTPTFDGYMNGGWTIRENRKPSGATVTVELKAVSELAIFDAIRGVQTNVISHQSADSAFASDTFFDTVPEAKTRKAFWAPDLE